MVTGGRLKCLLLVVQKLDGWTMRWFFMLLCWTVLMVVFRWLGFYVAGLFSASIECFLSFLVICLPINSLNAFVFPLNLMEMGFPAWKKSEDLRELRRPGKVS